VSLLTGSIATSRIDGSAEGRRLPGGRTLELTSVDDRLEIELKEARTGRTLRRQTARASVFLPDGAIVALRGQSLVRYDTRLEPAGVGHLPEPIGEGVKPLVLSKDRRYVAVQSRAPAKTPGTWSPGLTRIYDVRTLKPAFPGPAGCSLPEEFAVHPWGWSGVVSQSDFTREWVRFDRRGRQLGSTLFSDVWTSARKGDRVYGATEENDAVLRIDARSGRARRFRASWRPPLDRRYLPRSEGARTHYGASFLTLTPDEKTLILIEVLAGDPLG
jgi:hypothetical protein